MAQRPLIVVTTLVAVVVAGVLLLAAWIALRSQGPALAEASVSHNQLTPNADGTQDVAEVAYTLRRPATVSIYFDNERGDRFYFRRENPRGPGEYRVNFSGVVEAFTLPGEEIEGTVLARVLPDGRYTWTIEASEATGASHQISGPLSIAEADTTLPLLRRFTVLPTTFTPNQDGLSDRTRINVWLDKDVPEDGLRVALVNEHGTALPITEEPRSIRLGERGEHTFDYDGGIEQNLDPPPDGTYTIQAIAEDRLGQRVMVTNTLVIALGGLPRAQIVLGDVEWSDLSAVPFGETLYFTLTVENYGTVPIRTAGPFAGTVYGSMRENFNTLGEPIEAGAWRIGLHCDTCETDYPWRWALGAPEELTVIPDEADRPQFYLMPGQLATVTGGVVLDRVVASRNPQNFWAGLIHEEVRVEHDRVDPVFLEILEE